MCYQSFGESMIDGTSLGSWEKKSTRGMLVLHLVGSCKIRKEKFTWSVRESIIRHGDFKEASWPKGEWGAASVALRVDSWDEW